MRLTRSQMNQEAATCDRLAVLYDEAAEDAGRAARNPAHDGYQQECSRAQQASHRKSAADCREDAAAFRDGINPWEQ